jgi:hypothetical protein
MHPVIAYLLGLVTLPAIYFIWFVVSPDKPETSLPRTVHPKR